MTLYLTKHDAINMHFSVPKNEFSVEYLRIALIIRFDTLKKED